MTLKFPANKMKSKQNNPDKIITYHYGGITIVCIPITPTNAELKVKFIVSNTKYNSHKSLFDSAMIQLFAMNEA